MESPKLQSNDSIFKEIQTNFQNIHTYLNDEIFNRALGSIFGAFIGDSLGSYCQFRHQIYPNTLEQAMKMQGGGTFNLDPGQVTDDSQLALNLAFGILNSYNNKIKLIDQQQTLIISIAGNYSKWRYKDAPFDIGTTTSLAIDRIQQLIYNQQQNFIQRIQTQINRVNSQSQSNGYLMRITPSAIFCAFLDEDQKSKQKFIKDQIHLTHCQPVCLQSGYEWCWLISRLINRKHNFDQTQLREILKQFKERCSKKQQLKSWLDQVNQKKRMPGYKSMGWAKIAWTYGILILEKIIDQNPSIQDFSQLYKTNIQMVIRQAGDTDTNACIVGGLIGSIYGFKNLPREYIEKMMSLKFHKNSRMPRNQFYEPKNALKYVYGIYEKIKVNKSVSVSKQMIIQQK